ncbi:MULTISPECIES: DUF350 domain-containing protein [Kitasatospora]|uniref:DUF350 domain-containing protein n=1 Tax=Kitasatospora setae (strain ATCC 33774 / DSM 43861 / JCM 3304 / KCC A-0304 / NBRC 14216 / KM-6054) TaxID=452652 RepID=E4NJ93_KITSK|nr:MULTISPECIES: DUF350 domain-containing protein [Kitasatospora]BAJ33041.1 hypothetical protein KSE_72860 [Kitasatospora setae KM-6054]
MNDILHGLGAAAVYGLVGLVLLLLGYLLIDVLTPGKLGRLIWAEGNRNAAVLLSSALLGVGGIVYTAIRYTYDDFGKGLLSTLCFGVLGLLLMALAFWLLDLLTPGRLGAILVSTAPHPAVWVSASCNLAAAAIVAASIA